MSRKFVSKMARFTIIRSRLIRMEWSENGVFEDLPSQIFLDRTEDDCKCHVVDTENILIITTDYLHLEYLKDNRRFSHKNLSITFNLADERKVWKPGQKNTGNLHGTTRTLDDTNGESLNLEEGLVSRDGWALIDDSHSLVFNADGWIEPRSDNKCYDWYFFGYAHEYKDALQDFVQLAGKIPIPPKYAFGYWWSRYWNYSESELRRLVHEMKDNHIPLDVLIIDMDWHKTYGLSRYSRDYTSDGSQVGWTGYSWNKELFPDHVGLLKWLHERGIKVALNLHPASGIAPMEDCYNEFFKAYSEKDEKGYIPYRLADKKWKDTYFKLVIKKLEDEGVDFWWLDWQQFPESKVVPGLSNTWWLNHVFFTEMEKSGRRPLIFHRWGGLGNHRYQVGFSGDTRITWDSLKYQPYFTSTASNVGYGYWSHDIGGHFPNGDKTDPELYLRWLQFGIFSPIVRTHSTKAASVERRFWKFPDHVHHFKAALNHRYELVPYIYNNARKAYETGISICRPMYYEHPENEQSYTFKDQYYFGDEMICAPITAPVDTETGLVDKMIWLPEGEWFEWCSGTMFSGNCIITRNYDLSETPLFIKKGTIIPAFNLIQNITKTMNQIKFIILPGEQGETTLYDDDGATTKYLQNEYSTIKVTYRQNRNNYNLIIYPAEGSYQTIGRFRAVTLDFVNTLPPKSYSLSIQQHCNMEYIAEQLTTRLTFTKECDQAMEINIEFPDKPIDFFNGFRRFIRRFNDVAELLKYTVASDDWSGTLPDSVHHLQQLALRVESKSTEMERELLSLKSTIYKMYGELAVHPSVPEDVLKRIKTYLDM